MKKQNKNFTDKVGFRDTDQGFNAGNQNESQDVNKNEKGESSTGSSKDGNGKLPDKNDTSSHSFTDLKRDESGNLISNN